MPIYSYKCDNCGHRVENVFYTTIDRIKPIFCVHCETVMTTDVFPPSLRFIGDGWQTPRAEGDGGERGDL